MSYADQLRDAQFEFTRHIGYLINFAYANGFTLSFGEAFRTEYQQKEYLRTGRSQTLDSYHLKRLAVDFNIFVDGYYLFSDKSRKTQDIEIVKPLGQYWESLSKLNRWGGNFKSLDDFYHFERTLE